MTNSQRHSAVRQKLRAWFLDQQSDEPWEVRESILIREGFYCGRRFDFAGYRAVWFVEEDQVKVFRRDGALVESFQSADLITDQPADRLTAPALHRPSLDERTPAVQQPHAGQQAPTRRAA